MGMMTDNPSLAARRWVWVPVLLATSSNLAVLWAVWYSRRFEWWFIFYLTQVGLPVGLGGLAALGAAWWYRARDARGAKRYLVCSVALYCLWALYVSYLACTIRWWGH